AAIVPKAELLMLYCGLLGCGWFMRLVASNRICTCLLSLIRNCLVRLPSMVQLPGPMILICPIVPRLPGDGFCKTIWPDEFAMAVSGHPAVTPVRTLNPIASVVSRSPP